MQAQRLVFEWAAEHQSALRAKRQWARQRRGVEHAHRCSTVAGRPSMNKAVTVRVPRPYVLEITFTDGLQREIEMEQEP